MRMVHPLGATAVVRFDRHGDPIDINPEHFHLNADRVEATEAEVRGELITRLFVGDTLYEVEFDERSWHDRFLEAVR